jgi:hypothetical protein
MINSLDFAANLHKMKCRNITAGFVGEAGEIQKGEVEDVMAYTKFQSAVHSNNILGKVSEDKTHLLTKAVDMDEDIFLKAVKDQALEVYDHGSLNKFKSDLVKAAASGKVSSDIIEKAKKDLGKLTKVQVSDKNGQKRTVWVKRGGDDEASQGKQAKVAYASDTKTKEEGDHIISRAKAALDNPRTPMSMRAKAQEMIDAENKKWSKEQEAHSDYSNEKHPHHEAYKAGHEAAKSGGTSHAYDKNSESGKAKAEAWEAGHKAAGGGKKPDYDKELEDMYDKKTGGDKEKAPEEKKPVEKPKAKEKKSVDDTEKHEARRKDLAKRALDEHKDVEIASHILDSKKTKHTDLDGHEKTLNELTKKKKKIDESVKKLVAAGYSEDDANDFADEHYQGGSKLPAKAKAVIEGKYEKPSMTKEKAKEITSKYNKDGSEKSSMSKEKAKEITSKYNRDGSEKKAEPKKPNSKESDVIGGVNVRNLAKEAIDEEPEVEGDGEDAMATGACASITEHIHQNLKKKGIKSEVLDIAPTKTPYSGVGPDHTALYLPDHDLILDTQVWQYHSKTELPDVDISKRKITYTPEEYEKLGFEVPKDMPMNGKSAYLKRSGKKEAEKTPKKSMKDHLSDKEGWERNKEYDMDSKHVGGGIHAFKTDEDQMVYMSNPGSAKEKEHTEEEAEAAYKKHKDKVEKAMEDDSILEEVGKN